MIDHASYIAQRVRPTSRRKPGLGHSAGARLLSATTPLETLAYHCPSTKGGSTCKLHLAVDSHGMPVTGGCPGSRGRRSTGWCGRC